VAVAPGDLEQRGEPLQLRVAEKDAELLAEEAVADVVVPIAVRAERRLRVVHVQAAQAVEADALVEVGDQTVEHLPIGDVVARGEQVARVEADTEPLVSTGRVVDGHQLVERASDRVAGARCVLHA